MTLPFLGQTRAMRSALVNRLFCGVCAVFVGLLSTRKVQVVTLCWCAKKTRAGHLHENASKQGWKPVQSALLTHQVKPIHRVYGCTVFCLQPVHVSTCNFSGACCTRATSFPARRPTLHRLLMLNAFVTPDTQKRRPPASVSPTEFIEFQSSGTRLCILSAE